MANTLSTTPLGKGRHQLFSAQSAGGTTAAASVQGAGAGELAVYIKWGSGVTAGAVIVETADEVQYTGTWAPLATVPWTAASIQDVVQVSGTVGAIRTRISTGLTGGTVDSSVVIA